MFVLQRPDKRFGESSDNPCGLPAALPRWWGLGCQTAQDFGSKEAAILQPTHASRRISDSQTPQLIDRTKTTAIGPSPGTTLHPSTIMDRYQTSTKSIILLTLSLLLLYPAFATSQCRCFPGDQCWPTPTDWTRLNSSLNGHLIATVPLGSPCHDPTYNAAKCAAVQRGWFDPAEHYQTSFSIMAPYFANKSCDAFTPRSQPCTLGNYNDYAVNVTAPADVVKGIAFAKRHNIRLVVRNTGHDYNGKSVGAGSLAIWTHNLKDIEFVDYKSQYYTGKAYRAGAGIQGFEAYEAALPHNLTITSGECPTVGVAGGYTQGGGHSLLSSAYGLAADQALEWEVITSTGQHLTASRTQHRDLYWALSGGGGGTYAIVLALTAKAHPDPPVAAANISFTSANISQTTFHDAIAAYHAWAPALIDQGATLLAFGTNATFGIGPIIAPGWPLAKLEAEMRRFMRVLDGLGVRYERPWVQLFEGYWPAAQKMMATIAVGVDLYGGRLVPRRVVRDNPTGLRDALRRITGGGDGVVYSSLGVNLNRSVTGDVDNAVLPAWREALLDIVLAVPTPKDASMEELVALQRKMTGWVRQLEVITPGSGCYLNEGDFLDPHWKQTFYGANYERLRAVKARYDPDEVFWGNTAVGGDEWVVGEGGRLCRA